MDAAPPAAAGAPGGAPAAAAPQRGGIVPGLIRMALMWYVMKQFTGSKQAPVAPGGVKVPPLSPRLARSTPVDVHVFISETDSWRAAAANGAPPVWLQRDVPLGSTQPQHFRYTYRPSPAVQNNGSVFVHAVFTPPGAPADPEAENFAAAVTWGKSHPLNVWMPKRRAKDGVNLLSGKNSTDGEAMPDDTVAANETITLSSYLRPNVTIVFIDDYK
jgi:hypothetical protein